MRRCLLLLILLLFVQATHASGEGAPSLQLVKQQYQQWYGNFRKDMGVLHQRYQKNKLIKSDEINRIFRNSLAPNSNMTRFIDWLVKKDQLCTRTKAQREPISCSGEFSMVLVGMLQQAKPMSSGGIHQPSRGRVIYINLGNGDWNPYRNNALPKTNTLPREQYPFLIFYKIDDKIVLWSLSREFGKAMNQLQNRAFQ